MNGLVIVNVSLKTMAIYDGIDIKPCMKMNTVNVLEATVMMEIVQKIVLKVSTKISIAPT